MSGLRGAMFTTPEMAAVFEDRAFVQRMLDFEAALARAQARAGLLDVSAADAIARGCRADLFDLPALFKEAAESATPVVPLVRQLIAIVDDGARPFVHWGATSQDAIDTALMLQMRDGLDLLSRRLFDVASVCAALADRHRGTVMAGRTLLQHAVPITFGLKAARWLGLAVRLLRRLASVRRDALAVQLGGAAGTLAPYGDAGLKIATLLGEDLGLPVPEGPWHTERDRVAEIASAVGTVAGAMGKIATDLALLSQTEVGEISTGAGEVKGRSSTMPHKRNPVEATAAVACARLAIAQVSVILASSIQEHERSAGAWQAEWEAIPQLFRLTAGALEWVHRALTNLQVDAERMRANLDATGGTIMAEALTMALARTLGRPEAYRVVQRITDRAVASGIALADAALVDERVRKVLSSDKLAAALDVSGYLGSAGAIIDRALAAFRSLQQQEAPR